MTLYASIEKMKEHLESVSICINNEAVHDAIDKALAAAPAQAMTEDEIMTLIYETWDDKDCGGDLHKLMQALRDAGVLYVREGK